MTLLSTWIELGQIIDYGVSVFPDLLTKSACVSAVDWGLFMGGVGEKHDAT
jgi:hypothetical protein